MSAPRLAIIGGGVAGLTAARAAALAGVSVTVYESRDALGGAVGSAQVGELTLDTGAESIAVRGRRALELLRELGLEESLCSPNGAGSWLRLSSGRSVPMPAGGLLGIPLHPGSRGIRAAIGLRGSLRACRDLIFPAPVSLRASHTTSLGALVSARLGSRVRTELVAPVTRGVYSADPEDLDPALAAPGLLEAYARSGSLIRAARELRAAAVPGAAVRGISGGLHTLVARLAEDAAARGVSLRTHTEVTGLVEGPTGWRLTLSGGESVIADAVLLAGATAPAQELLGALGVETGGADVSIVSLVVDAPELSSAPRGNGVLVAEAPSGSPRRVRAKALTHSSAKWSWLADALSAAGAGHQRHAIRLSYGIGASDAPHLGEAPDGETARIDLALADASELLGVPLTRDQLRAGHVAHWRGTQPGAAHGRAERTAQIRATLAEQGTAGTLDGAGAWLAGTGLAAVIPDAEAAAARLLAALGALPSAHLHTEPLNDGTPE